MGGLVFEIQQPVVASAPNRADIACFVGLVGRRRHPLPLQLRRWLQDGGWVDSLYAQGESWLLCQQDLRDPVGLAITLQKAARPAVRHVRQHLDHHAPGLLTVTDPEEWGSDRWQQALLVGLNSLLQGESLYDANPFKGESLDPDTQSLLAQPLRDEILIHLNRRLVQQVFPEAIAHSQLLALEELLNVPVPIDSWDLFDYLFAWDERYLGVQMIGTSYLGAAVRSFFAQGGTKCYVVRVGDPGFLLAPQTIRQDRLRFLLPGYPNRLTVTPSDRRTWRGIGHLFGLPDVSFLALPDLPDLLSVDREEIPRPKPLPLTPETFAECSEAEPLVAESLARFLTAPRCDELAYQEWSMVLNQVGHLLAQYGREVQFVAALPLPTEPPLILLGLWLNLYLKAEKLHLPMIAALSPLLISLIYHLILRGSSSVAQSPLPALLNQGSLSCLLDDSPMGIASAFVQLVYSWAKTSGSTRLPEQLENPEGILVGVLARNALNQGAFRSAAGLGLVDVYEVFPLLSREQTESLHASKLQATAARHSLMERVSLLGLTPGGWRLCSDVTTSLDDSYRPACVNRLVSSLVRAARRLGEEYTFENSGEFLWGRLRESLSSLLLGLLQAGALRGDTVDDAFQVRCDRTTMTQADLDNGRVIVQVLFTAALPIEQITVFLALNESGQIAVLPAQPPAPVSA